VNGEARRIDRRRGDTLASTALPGAAGEARGSAPVVAVFDIEDTASKLPRKTLEQLSTYLATPITRSSRQGAHP
jgi:hypothetical protein